MGSVQKSPNEKGWVARWRTPDGKTRKKTFKLKVEASRHVAEMEAAGSAGSYVDPSAGRVTFEQYAEGWRKIQQHRPSTAEQVETMLRRHAYPTIGGRQIGSLRPSELQAWVKFLEGSLAPATIEVVARHVISVLRAAVRDRLIVESPADGLKLPKQSKVEIVPLTVAQVISIANTIQPRYRALVMLMAGTGLRPAEAFGLSNDRFDWLQKTLRVDRQLVTIGGVAEFGPPKTEASARSVPVPTFLVESTAEHVRRFGLGADELLFTNANGERIRRNRFGDVWRQTMKGLDFDCRGPHQLRHHYASLLIQHGESVKVVQKRLGHASATETLDTYSHLWPESADSTRAAVEVAYLSDSINASDTQRRR